MNELKPEYVMRALECCEEKRDCSDCPYKKYHYDRSTGLQCSDYLRIDALALLREKDAEIERLTVNMNAYGLTAKNLAQEFEDYRADVQMEIADARAEAITEFEKKLMEKKCHYTETEHTFDFDGVTVEDIEQTAKELKGEPDEL